MFKSDIVNKVIKDNTVVPPLPEDRFLNSFQHIFAGGYSAGESPELSGEEQYNIDMPYSCYLPICLSRGIRVLSAFLVAHVRFQQDLMDKIGELQRNETQDEPLFVAFHIEEKLSSACRLLLLQIC